MNPMSNKKFSQSPSIFEKQSIAQVISDSAELKQKILDKAREDREKPFQPTSNMFTLKGDSSFIPKSPLTGGDTRSMTYGRSPDLVYGGFKTKVPHKTKGSSVKDGKVKAKLSMHKKQTATQSLYKHKGSFVATSPTMPQHLGVLHSHMDQISAT